MLRATYWSTTNTRLFSDIGAVWTVAPIFPNSAYYRHVMLFQFRRYLLICCGLVISDASFSQSNQSSKRKSRQLSHCRCKRQGTNVENFAYIKLIMIIVTRRPSKRIHMWKDTELAVHEATWTGKGSCHHRKHIHRVAHSQCDIVNETSRESGVLTQKEARKYKSIQHNTKHI